jgi:NAD(P)-dependent dehydrogenase (short-subunit alcohol dehydrogenase family)
MSTGIVIGASGGIGSAAALALAGSVDRLVLAGRRRETLDSLAARIGPSAVAAEGDIADDSGRTAVVDAVDGPLAWVVLASGMPLRRPMAELSAGEIEMAFAVNLVGPALLLRRLLDCEWTPPSAIAVVGSISASRSLPDRAVYGATKAGLEHLARSLAAELAPAGIRVNVVSPGVIDTPFLGEATEALDAWVGANVPQGRSGTADEVAELVRYALLEAPAYLTGARIVVDGGVEARA